MRKPPPAEQVRGRRERILDAAFHAFATRGYRDTAVDDIAGAAETSKGGIYFHFPTKESIFRELMETTADKLVAQGRAGGRARDGAGRPRGGRASHAVLATFAGPPDDGPAAVPRHDRRGPRCSRPRRTRLHDRFARLIQGYLDEAVAAGAIPPIDTRIASIAWFGALNEVVAPLAARRPPGPARGRLSGAARDPAAAASACRRRASARSLADRRDAGAPFPETPR